MATADSGEDWWGGQHHCMNTAECPPGVCMHTFPSEAHRLPICEPHGCVVEHVLYKWDGLFLSAGDKTYFIARFLIFCSELKHTLTLMRENCCGTCGHEKWQLLAKQAASASETYTRGHGSIPCMALLYSTGSFLHTKLVCNDILDIHRDCHSSVQLKFLCI